MIIDTPRQNNNTIRRPTISRVPWGFSGSVDSDVGKDVQRPNSIRPYYDTTFLLEHILPDEGSLCGENMIHVGLSNRARCAERNAIM